MRMIAIQTVKLGGVHLTPGTEFDIDGDEAKKLIALGAAQQKTRVVADDDDDKLPLAEVLAMAEKEGVSFAAFKSAASKHLSPVPGKKDDIVTALLALPPEQPAA